MTTSPRAASDPPAPRRSRVPPSGGHLRPWSTEHGPPRGAKPGSGSGAGRARTERAVNRLCAWVFAAVALVPAAAAAQTPPDVTAQISQTEVEVGEPFTVQLKAMSEDGAVATGPELRAPSGFSVSGPMLSTQSYMSFGTGGRRVLQGIGATWTLVASAPGTFTIPAPTVMWSGQRIAATPLSVKVAPQGTLPRRQPGGFLFPGGNPFGSGSPFGPNWPFGANDDEPDDLGDDPSLSLPRAPAKDVFLRVKADKTRAVVGEQVTLSVYLYYAARSISERADTSRLPLKDFLQIPLMPDGSQATYTARAGGRAFSVRLLEKIAVFPLRTGVLHTGSYSETFLAYNRRTRIKRSSEDVLINVTEPPVANRPVGYRLGDVGQFQVTALVQPRRVEEGGSVAVSVKVTGSGNFPTSLQMPEKTGVEWLDPEKKESLEPRGEEITGFRSFGYVVRLTTPGSIDLGAVELPHWNPRAKRYEVARSQLGKVEVTPSKSAAPTPSATASGKPENEEAFAHLPPPRTTLSPYSAPSGEMLLQGPAFALALGLPPLVALAGIGGVELARRARSRLSARRSSPRTLAGEALRDARKAKASGDERAAAAAAERAVVLAIEGATGLKARGLLKEELAPALVEAGVDGQLAERASALLAACDRARFDPLAAAEVHVADAEALVADLLRARVS